MKSILLEHGKFALGLALGSGGLLMGAVLLDYNGLLTPKDPTIFGAIIGGFLAGFASLVATVLTNYFFLRDSLQRKNDQEEALTLSCFQKVHAATDTLLKAYRHYFDGSVSNVVHYTSPKGETRRIPKPLDFSSIERAFSDAELSLPLLFKHAELFNNLSEFEGQVSMFNKLTSLYSERFKALERQMLSASDLVMDGRAMQASVNLPVTAMMEVEDIRDLLLGCIAGGRANGEKVHAELIKIIEERYGRKITFEIDPILPGHIGPES